MTYNLIDFDGFEKYGPIANGATWSSFAALTSAENLQAVNQTNTFLPSQSMLLEWQSLSWPNTNQTKIGLIQGLNGTGIAIAMRSNNLNLLTRQMPANYSHVTYGYAFMTNLGGRGGVGLLDSNVAQITTYCDTTGRICVDRGGIGGTRLFTSAALILTNTRNYVEVDVLIHPSAGTLKISLNGVDISSGGLTGLNTRATANSFVNGLQLAHTDLGPTLYAFDDVYWQDNTAGTHSMLGDCTIDGLIATADSAVQFSPAAAVVAISDGMGIQTVNTNAPGANFLYLQPVTPATNRTINSVSQLAAATSATAKFKAVVYSDNAGAPGSLLSSGNEVTGCTNQVVMTGGLVTPQALTGGTQYWIGFICDTSIAIYNANGWSTTGQKKANTYGSGAPAGPLSGMTTGQSNWAMWGNCTSVTGNVDQINDNPPAYVQNTAYGYNSDATVGHADLFTMSDLPVTPTTIYSVKVSVLAQRSDAGARTMDVQLKSGGITSAGSLAGQTPPTNMNWLASRYDTDPNTSAAWTAAGVNGITAGYKVAS